MSRISNLIIGAIGLTGVATAGYQDGRPSPSAANPSNVMVVNPTTQPVPTSATGTTNVAGTVGLSAGTTVGLASGTSIGITGTPSVSVSSLPAVQIGNSSANPIPSTTVETRTPVFVKQQLQINDGSVEFDPQLYTVPDGKRLFVKYVTGRGAFPGTQRVTLFDLSGSNGVDAFIPTTDQASTPNYEFWQASQMVDLEFDPGTVITVFCVRSDSVGTSFATLGFSGYLEPVGG